MLTTAERKELFIIAFKEYQSITGACNALGMGRSTYYFWMDNDEEFEKVINVMERDRIEERLDLAEEGLTENIRDRVSSDIKFYLNSHGSKRGYGKAREVNVNLGDGFSDLDAYPEEPGNLEEWEALKEGNQGGKALVESTDDAT